MIDQPFLDLFTNIESREGLFLWLTMLISFFLGFIVALLLRWGKIRRLKRELKDSQEKEKSLQSQLISLQNQLQARNAELQEESQEKVALLDRVRELEQAREQQLQEVVILNQSQEELQTTNRQLIAQASDLNDQIVELKTSNDQLRAQGGGAPLPTEVDSNAYQSLQARLASVENRLALLAQENDQLRQSAPANENTPPLIQEIDNVTVEPDPQIQSEKTVLYDKIIVADREQDDLTRIEGVGSFLEKKLNSIGVFSYEEIAGWGDSRIAEVTKAIEYLPGRIEKDRWVEQAAELAAARERAMDQDATEEDTDIIEDGADLYQATASRQVTEEVPSSSISSSSKSVTDLKVIEGVGPKIEEVLKNAGINDWNTLAATGPGQLKEILEEAGDRFRMHNPYTWPLQARLAAGGRWDELAEYQNELKGGKEK